MEEKIKYYIKIILIAIIGIIIGFKTSVNEVNAASLKWDEVVVWNLQWTRLKTCNNTSYCIYNSSSNNIFFVGGNTKNFTITPNVLYEIKGEINLSNSMPLYNNTEPFSFYYLDSEGKNQGSIECITGGIITSYGLESVDNTRGVTTRTIDCQFKTKKTNIKGFGWSTQVSNWNNIQIVTDIQIKILQDNSDIINNQNQNTQNVINNQNQNTDKIINEGTFVKPEEDLQIKDSEEKEEEIYDLFDGVDINAITIDFDSTSVTKIFELLNRIITQNTIIQTMIITILSISIIKLVLGR